MNISMIKIERNEKMEKATARCRNVHPKVRRVDAQTVTVYGSKGDAYTVRFAEPKAGLKLAACDCPAGRESKLCYCNRASKNVEKLTGVAFHGLRQF